jgi:hypothetical protein
VCAYIRLLSFVLWCVHSQLGLDSSCGFFTLELISDELLLHLAATVPLLQSFKITQPYSERDDLVSFSNLSDEGISSLSLLPHLEMIGLIDAYGEFTVAPFIKFITTRLPESIKAVKFFCIISEYDHFTWYLAEALVGKTDDKAFFDHVQHLLCSGVELEFNISTRMTSMDQPEDKVLWRAKNLKRKALRIYGDTVTFNLGADFYDSDSETYLDFVDYGCHLYFGFHIPAHVAISP